MSYSEGGLGWKVWGTALLLARQLAASPPMVRSKGVLELGSGCGLAGLVAAKLGATAVTLTDCVPEVLENLRENVAHLPAEPVQGGLEADAGGRGGGWEYRYRGTEWEEAGTGGDAEQQLQQQEEEEEEERRRTAGCDVRVRYLEWGEDSGMETAGLAPVPLWANQEVPRVGPQERFAAIIASDVIYQPGDVAPIVSVIKRRLLEPHGICHVTHTVRSRALLDQWLAAFEAAGLAVEVERIPPPSEGPWEGQPRGARPRLRQALGETEFGEVGVRATASATTHGADYYEGGFVSLTVRHM